MCHPCCPLTGRAGVRLTEFVSAIALVLNRCLVAAVDLHHPILSSLKSKLHALIRQARITSNGSIIFTVLCVPLLPNLYGLNPVYGGSDVCDYYSYEDPKQTCAVVLFNDLCNYILPWLWPYFAIYLVILYIISTHWVDQA